MTLRNLGCLHDDPASHRGEPLDRIAAVRAIGVLPESVDLTQYVTTIPDQRGSSCVGHAIAQCLRIRAAIMGRVIDPSALAIYAEARSFESPGLDRLPDVGSYPEKAFAALAAFGAVDRLRWDDDADLGAPVTVDVYEAGYVAIVTGEYAIPTGPGCDEEIRKALAAGYPVFWTRNVDEAYMDLENELYTDMLGPSKGGHAGCLMRYDANSFSDAGSWSRNHGVNGFARIGTDFIQSENVRQLKVVTFALMSVQ